MCEGRHLVTGPGEWLRTLSMLAVGTGVLTAGFGAGLEGLRRWLYPDARITGRRSFIAGLLAPIAVFVVGSLLDAGVALPQMLGLLFVVPLALALVMFFAWLTPTPDELRDEGYLNPDELPGRLLESWAMDARQGREGPTATVARPGAGVARDL